MVLPTPPPTPPPPPAPISPLTQADVDALVAGALAHPPQELPAWLPLGVAAFIRATIAASAASEEDLRARAVAQMEAESAHLPNGSPVAAPDYFRRDRAHPGRPAAWIRDWDSGALRPRRLLDDLWEAPAELEPDEDDATGQNSEDGAEEQGGGEESQPDAVEQRG